MRSKCYVHRRQRLAASTAKDQGGWDTVGEENGRTGRRPARTRVAGPRRMSLGAAMLLVIVLGPALDVRQRPSTSVSGSEFPERECCDPVYPPMPDPEPVPGPAYPTTTISTSSSFQTGQSGMGGGGLLGGSGGIGGAGGGSTAVGNELGGGLIGTGSGSQLSSSRPMHIGYSGSNIKTAIAILNCILARQLCFEDPSCSAILEIIPRVCGPVPVACSTVTVTKCQAALRTLQAFPFFRPTCLCKEPGMDPDCNYFRDFLFDHPCGFVSKKEKDPYPVDALPTCNHALSVCQQERKCIKLFEDFKLHCKVRENKCRMEDRDLCYEAWTNLRLSPMFGCICPNNHMKRRCDKIFSVVNHNPCVVGSDDIEEKEAEMSFIHFQSTCHLALDSCRDDQVCSSALKTVLMHCDQHRCNRNACMESLQSFYKSIHDDLSLDIAFCLCRKTPNRHDSCMIAQEKLHPVCAQRPPESLSQQSSSTGNGIAYNAPPACHAVAELCREDEDCRARLEVFEQSCAVDSVTKKCAGKTSACRQAMLGILGTPLRTTCACQGSDMQQLYDCLGWQRLLWLNPCVVESQKDFHLKRLAELGLLTTTTTMATTTTTIATTTTLRTTRVTQPPTPPPTKPKPVYRPKPTEMHTVESNYVETPDTRPETLVHNQNGVIERSDIDRGHQHPPPDEYDRSTGTRHQSVDSDSEDDMTGQYGKEIYQRPDEQVLHVASTEVQEVETLPPTTITTTTTEPTTTPVPIRYCVVQRSHQPDQLIAEGKSRRLYILDDAECSELCTCGGGDSLALTCHALCVPLAPCRTALAYYSHAAPAYQAFRGRCLCYSGRFICMRPPPGEYQLPGGIFLLLGYSSTDEALLRPHTNLGVQDAVRALQQYVLQHIDNSTLCTLTLFNITEENIILSIRLPLDPKLTPMQLLKLEKDQCTRILEAISHQINTQYVELSAHRLLSIFKMAEVQIVWPEVSYARRHTTPSLVVSLMTGVATVLLTLCGTLVPPFVRWTQHHQRWPAASRLVT
uniref:GDNF/GAS1 domain-containing protein n=1 Tax=Anopheles funestus TaxID=62324 RepID=A0A1I8JU64_ANOFN